MLVTERSIAHVCQTNAALAAAVRKDVAVVGVELGRSNDLQAGRTPCDVSVVCKFHDLHKWQALPAQINASSLSSLGGEGVHL